MHGWKISSVGDLQDVGQCATIAALYITEAAPLYTICEAESFSQRPGQLLIMYVERGLLGSRLQCQNCFLISRCRPLLGQDVRE